MTLATISESFKQQLSSWARSGELTRSIERELVATSLPNSLQDAIQSWGAKDFAHLPDIQILDHEALLGHLGAYSAAENKIYLNSLLQDNPLTSQIVLMHELGHYIVSNYLEPPSEKNINRFVGDLIPSAFDTFDALKQQDNGAKSIRLPNGEVIDAAFFDTALHISAENTALYPLRSLSKETLALGQNHCDDPNFITNQFGLQYNSRAHFDNNNISGSLAFIKGLYQDALSNFNTTTDIPESKWNRDWKGYIDFNDPDWISGKINPAFTGPNAGLDLLLYRFGQILHILQDFYTHSNWSSLLGDETSGKPLPKNSILDQGLGLPTVLEPGDAIPGTRTGRTTLVVSNFVDWSQRLRVAANSNDYPVQKLVFGIGDEKIYWKVNSDEITVNGSTSLKDPTLQAVTLDGQDVFGLATGATWDLPYREQDYSVALVDKSKQGMTIARSLFRGFDHGGMAGTGNVLLPDPFNPFAPAKRYNKYLGPLARDAETVPGHDAAMALATLQTRHEWDRLGNLILANYGPDGLTRFANYALDPSYRQTYISTYSTPGGTWAWPADSYFSADYQTATSADNSLNNVEIRPITEVFKDPVSGELTSKLLTQFKLSSGSWTDSAFDDLWSIDRHSSLSNEIIQKITTPRPASHASDGARAFWTEQNNDDGNDGQGTIYYIESRNKSVPIHIDNFTLGIDKVVLVDDSGLRLLEVGNHWGEREYKSGQQEILQAFNISLNATPTSHSQEPAWVISKDQISKADGSAQGVALSAASFFNDYDFSSTENESKLFFDSLEGEIPFIKLIDGKLVATSDISKYSKQEFTTVVGVSDGAGGSTDQLIRIVVDPSLTTNGSDSIQPGQLFDVRFSKQGSEAYSLYASIDINDGQDGINYFSMIASVSGAINGNPTGYNPLAQQLRIGTTHDSGTVKLWLQNSQSKSPIELRTERDSQGSYRISNGSELVAMLTPVSEATSANSIHYDIGRFSLQHVSGTASGLEVDSVINNGFSLSYSTFSSASYSSTIGFYLTDRRHGTIVDPITGEQHSANTSELASTIEKYKVFESGIIKNNSSSQVAKFNFDASIDSRNIIFTPFIKTDTGKSTYMYGCDAALNPDGIDHIVKMGAGTFGVEDIFGGGDKDYNDIIVSFGVMQAL